MSDRTLTCRDCGQTFTFTAGEQAFYTERGFSEPTRCKACRDKRKLERNSSGGGGYDSYGGGGGGYSSSSSYGDSGGGGGYGGGGGRDYNSAPRQMYPAVCSSCGKQTEVPFQPRSDKPVYCRDCFQARRVTSSGYGDY
ncbi:MAG: CxxC-x17-CxxC domain-containing protein [Thermomicrobiales bacterium]